MAVKQKILTIAETKIQIGISYRDVKTKQISTNNEEIVSGNKDKIDEHFQDKYKEPLTDTRMF